MRLRLYHLTWMAVLVAMLDYRFFAKAPGVPSITLLQLVSLMLLFALGMQAITKRRVRRVEILVHEGRWVVMYFLWAGIAALWGILHSNYQSAAYLEDLLPSLVLFVLVILSVHSRSDLYGLLTAYKIGMSIELLIGASQVLSGEPRFVPLNEGSQWKTDLLGTIVAAPERLPTGLFTHPNGYALFLIPFAFMLITGIIYQPRLNAGRRLVNMGLLLLMGLVLWRAYSKGAYAWILLGMVLVMLPSALPRFRLSLGWLILLGGIIGLTVFSLQEGIGTMLSRYGLWQAAFAVFKNPLVLMLGNGNDAMLIQSTQFSNMYYPSSHNTFLDQVIVFGLPALLIYGVIAINAIRDSARISTSLRPEERGIGIFLNAGLVALLGSFFFEPALFGTMLQAQFFLLAAFTIVLHRVTHRAVGKMA